MPNLDTQDEFNPQNDKQDLETFDQSPLGPLVDAIPLLSSKSKKKLKQLLNEHKKRFDALQNEVKSVINPMDLQRQFEYVLFRLLELNGKETSLTFIKTYQIRLTSVTAEGDARHIFKQQIHEAIKAGIIIPTDAQKLLEALGITKLQNNQQDQTWSFADAMSTFFQRSKSYIKSNFMALWQSNHKALWGKSSSEIAHYFKAIIHFYGLIKTLEDSSLNLRDMALRIIDKEKKSNDSLDAKLLPSQIEIVIMPLLSQLKPEEKAVFLCNLTILQKRLISQERDYHNTSLRKTIENFTSLIKASLEKHDELLQILNNKQFSWEEKLDKILFSQETTILSQNSSSQNLQRLKKIVKTRYQAQLRAALRLTPTHILEASNLLNKRGCFSSEEISEIVGPFKRRFFQQAENFLRSCQQEELTNDSLVAMHKKVKIIIQKLGELTDNNTENLINRLQAEEKRIDDKINRNLKEFKEEKKPLTKKLVRENWVLTSKLSSDEKEKYCKEVYQVLLSDISSADDIYSPETDDKNPKTLIKELRDALIDWEVIKNNGKAPNELISTAQKNLKHITDSIHAFNQKSRSLETAYTQEWKDRFEIYLQKKKKLANNLIKVYKLRCLRDFSECQQLKKHLANLLAPKDEDLKEDNSDLNAILLSIEPFILCQEEFIFGFLKSCLPEDTTREQVEILETKIYDIAYPPVDDQWVAVSNDEVYPDNDDDPPICSADSDGETDEETHKEYTEQPASPLNIFSSFLSQTTSNLPENRKKTTFFEDWCKQEEKRLSDKEYQCPTEKLFGNSKEPQAALPHKNAFLDNTRQGKELAKKSARLAQEAAAFLLGKKGNCNQEKLQKKESGDATTDIRRQP